MDHDRQLREDAAACDFVAQLLDDRDRGAERDLAAYQACFPGFAARIAAEHAALLAGAAAPPEPPPEAGRDVGPYRLLEQLGHGGQGIVFRAEHRELKRVVALKMLHRGLLGLSIAQRARLRREAITVARLDDPAICPVYEVELDGPEPYLAMRFVPGRSLAAELERVRQQRAPVDATGLPPRTRAEVDAWLAFFERAAAGLHAAHQVGIVHRDVKPHNLMRTPDGEPVLLDFGLARDVTSTSGALTGSGELFGTLAYMAPELLAGGAEPHPRHDVYALGAALYEMLTLQQPFAAATPEALWRRIDAGDATAPRTLNPDLPRDLDVVVATALERDPARRYPTAQALAEDLRRLRLREPILARSLGHWRRAARWGRRHPVVSVVLLLLLLGFAVVAALYGEVLRSNAELVRSNRELQAMVLANSSLLMSAVRPHDALEDAVRAARDAPMPEVASLLLQVLDRCHLERCSARVGALLTCALAASGSGEVVAAPYRTGEVKVLHVAAGTTVELPAVGGQGWGHAEFGGTPERLLVAGADAVLRAFDPRTLHCEREWRATTPGDLPTPAATTSMAVSSDRLQVARGDATGCVDVIDLTGVGAPLRWQVHEQANVSFVAFDPSGERVLTFSKDHPAGGMRGEGMVAITDVRTGAILQRFGPFLGVHSPYHAAWSPDGAWIAVAYDDGAVRVHEAGSGAPVERFRIRYERESKFVAFDPVRARLWTCGLGGLAVFDCATGRELHRVDDFGDRSPVAICFSADHARAAVIANDATCRIFAAADLRLQRTLVNSTRSEGVCWAAGGQRVLSATSQSVLSWYADERPFLPDLQGHTDRVWQVHFDASGAEVVSASADGSVRIWSARGGTARAVLPHDGPVHTARFSADATRVLTTCRGGPARVWTRDPPHATALGAIPASDAWFFDADRRIVTIDDDGWLRGYDLDGRSLFAHRAHPPVPAWSGDERQETKIWSAAWHPSRPWLATGAGTREVCMFDCLEQKEVFRSSPWPDPEGSRRRAFCLAFAPDGESIVAGCEDGGLRAWSMAGGHPAWSIRREGATPGFLLFERDGAHLVVAGLYSAGVAQVSAVPADSLGATNGSVHTPVNVTSSLRLDASGRLVLCADKGGNLAVFEVRPWRKILDVRASDAPLLDAEFSPDGTQVVTGDASGRVRIWPVDPLPVAERAIPRGLPPR